MKKVILLLLCAFCCFTNYSYALTRTSIANGNWNNPAIWSPAGVPQITDDIIIINSNVNFSQNIVHGTIEFRINQGASLVSTGQDTLTLGCATAIINGYLQCAVINSSTSDSTVNSGTIVAGEFVQGGTLVNNAGGAMCISLGLFTSDVFVNNGSVNTASWVNSAQTSGAGKYCIALSFVNSGDITGSGDVCDATPGGANDIDVGTIAQTITICQTGPCVVCGPAPNAVNEIEADVYAISVAPNPMNEQATFTIHTPVNDDTWFELLNIQGQIIRTVNLTSTVFVLDRNELEAGIYLYRVVNNGVASKAGKLIVQ